MFEQQSELNLKSTLDKETWNHEAPSSDDLIVTMKLNTLDNLQLETPPIQEWVSSGHGSYKVVKSMLFFQSQLLEYVLVARNVPAIA